MGRVLEFHLSGKTILLNDLPPKGIKRALDGTGINWITFGMNPLEDPDAFEAVLAYVAEYLGAEPPPEEMTMRQYLDSFEWVDDDLPKVYEDGLPDPHGGDQTTE